MKKTFSPARLVAVLILALVSESSWALEVTMDLKAQGEGYPVIEGTTNLPDGVDVMITLTIPGVYMGQSQTVVSNGKFVSERFSSNNNSPVPSGTARVDVTTSLPDLQATSVRSIIGEKGEKMTGPLIFTLPGFPGRTIKVSTILQIP
ncbi:hypothetical protein [Pseudomonas coronafaciens]|uniref:hypothetical protein n=1 Tax=Pseudomonas coronafaciens TaxID=53409 RepID=UPI0037B79FD1